MADPLRVVLAAPRQVRGRGRGARRRQVLAGHEVQERAVAGDGALQDRGPAGGDQPRALRLGDARREGAEGRVEHALLGIGDDVRADGDVVAVQDHARQREPGAQPLPHVGDLLGDVGRERAQARDVVLVVARGGERRVTGQIGEAGVEAAVRGDGQPPLAQLVGGHVVAQLGREHVVADAVLGVQARARDVAQAGQRGLLALRRPLEIGGGHRGQAIVVTVVPRGRGQKRVLSQPRFPVLVDQRVEGGGRARRPDGMIRRPGVATRYTTRRCSRRATRWSRSPARFSLRSPRAPRTFPR